MTPVKNIVNVKIEHPAKARPGEEIEVALRLSDDAGKPLAGEATFWMVDQAVLSLAKERPLDPLPDFIVERETKMAARDTRNMAFGVIPLEEIAGGDGDDLQEWGAENNISVRKNFTPVPIYLPSVKIGADGVAKIKVQLPDTLTVFKLRAKAVSGPDRFGAAGGEMLIRQELVAQPALPRFVRPGDAFDIGLVARIVEGPGGAGKASIAAPALTLSGETQPQDRMGRRTSRCASICAPRRRPSSHGDVTLGFRIERDADQRERRGRDRPAGESRIASRRAATNWSRSRPAKRRRLLPAGEQARPGSFSREAIVAADPVAREARRRTECARRISLWLHRATAVARARRAGAEELRADSRGGGARGSRLRQCEIDGADHRPVDRRRRARRLLAARARQCLADRLVL